jgi:hypothetical protein
VGRSRKRAGSPGMKPTEAFQAVDLDPGRHGGVGRPSYDVHLVAQASELAGQAVEVDALPAGVHATVVHERIITQPS